MIEIEIFWCCMPALEKAAALLAAAAYIINPAYMERAPLDALFAAGGIGGSLYRLPEFIYTWGLLPSTVTIDEVEIEVYLFALPGIPTYEAFWLAGEFACECLCEILRFPDPC